MLHVNLRKKWTKCRLIISFIIMLTLSPSQTHVPVSSEGACELLLAQLLVKILQCFVSSWYLWISNVLIIEKKTCDQWTPIIHWNHPNGGAYALINGHLAKNSETFLMVPAEKKVPVLSLLPSDPQFLWSILGPNSAAQIPWFINSFIY